MTTPNIENYLPIVQYNGFNTAKNISLNSAANFDGSGSTGTFKTTTGAVTIGNGAVSVTGALTVSGTATFTSTVAGFKPVVISGSAATVTLTAAQSGAVVLFDSIAGNTFILPAPVAGLNFTFMCSTTVTSNTFKIITDAATTFLLGTISLGGQAGAATTFVSANITNVAIGMNGSTMGGVKGSVVSLTCVNATNWIAEGMLAATGSIVNPFLAQ